MHISNKQKKILDGQFKQAQFLEEKRVKQLEAQWEEAQVTAASAKSVLDYMVEQFNQHKEELTEEIIKQTEEQIALRQNEIKDFLMTAKERYEKDLKGF
jgi:F0F1-type ATP synthase membrane subunit b/b'